MNNIRKAAEIVGWQSGERFPHEKEDWYWDDPDSDKAFCIRPFEKRSHLHALVGLLEDKVREKYPELRMELYETGCTVCIDGSLHVFGDNSDWLLARLEALLKAVSDE